MIHDEMREKFLIIGITGPLRSGCTEAANILCDELSKKVSEREHLISKYQSEIIDLYGTISKAKGKEKSDAQLLNLRRCLLNKIKTRNILNSLSLHKDDKPVYISMTEMLLKTVVEYYFSNDKNVDIKADNSEDIDNCRFLLSQIDKIDFSYIDYIIGEGDEKINNIIKKRKYNELCPEKADNIDRFVKYLRNISDLRKIIQEEFNTAFLEKGGERYSKLLQDIGDNIRRCSNPFDYSSYYEADSSHIWKLSEQANDVIKFYKNCYRFWEDRTEFMHFLEPHIFVIENFRNPLEAEYFRLRYYEFFLLSVHCNKKERLRREYEVNPIYKKRGITKEQIEPFFDKIDSRDSGEKNHRGELYKQNVRDSVHLADITIINEGTKEEYTEKVLKYYTLIRNPGSFHPSNDELFMHIAYSMSLRSKCISRKVGAVIIGEKNYIIGAGWNEVGEGQIGCGDRTIRDVMETDETCIPVEVRGNNKFRDYLKTKHHDELDISFCFREAYQEFLKKEDDKNKENDQTRSPMKLKAQQFCRALHAEENAIIQTAKIGGMGLQSGTIYTTTFPCELCAKKIYQSGLKKIVYTEPYPEAISEDVFLKDGIRTIEIQPFEGVKSHSYYRLYKSPFDLKDIQAIEAKMEG